MSREKWEFILQENAKKSTSSKEVQDGYLAVEQYSTPVSGHPGRTHGLQVHWRRGSRAASKARQTPKGKPQWPARSGATGIEKDPCNEKSGRQKGAIPLERGKQCDQFHRHSGKLLHREPAGPIRCNDASNGPLDEQDKEIGWAQFADNADCPRRAQSRTQAYRKAALVPGGARDSVRLEGVVALVELNLVVLFRLVDDHL